MPLEEMRKQIDKLDEQLVKLLNERARVVEEIGKLKNKTDKPIYAPDREKEILEKGRFLTNVSCQSGVS
jgi:chorismate mutase/prephenate dehydratase